MAGIIYELIDVLAEQKECYEGLMTLATYKTEAVVQKNMDVLKQVVEREEQFIGRVQILDHSREVLLKDIALVTGLDYRTITLTRLIDKIGKDGDASQKLIPLRQELLELVEKVREQNELNKQLISQSMEYVDFTINAIKTTQFTELQANYTKPGMSYEERTRSLFDQQQ